MSDLSKYRNKVVRAFTSRAGALAPILLSPVQISEAYDPQPDSPASVVLPYFAIWDTGATSTVITPKVVAELGLKPSGKVMVRGVGPAGAPQAHQSNTYLVNIILPNNVRFVGTRVSENSIEGGDVLIGMDIITAGDLAITNHNGETTFTFCTPSCEEIDFVAEIQEHNRRFAGKTALTPDQQRQLKNKQKAQRRKNR